MWTDKCTVACGETKHFSRGQFHKSNISFIEENKEETVEETSVKMIEDNIVNVKRFKMIDREAYRKSRRRARGNL